MGKRCEGGLLFQRMYRNFTDAIQWHTKPHPCMAPPTHDIFFPSAECGEAMVHRHCRDRAPPCKAHIASGAYVTMSRKKVIKSLDDIDRLGKFLLDKVREEL